MATLEAINRIAETLRDSGLTWLLPNLRQDLVVWDALTDLTFFEKVIQGKPAGTALMANDFSPANLALVALDRPDLSAADPGKLLDSIDGQSFHLAMRNFPDQAEHEDASQALASAGLLAISWLGQYHETHSWDGLLQAIGSGPSQDWMAPVACLYSFLDDPARLLRALADPGAPSIQHELAVHAIFSNPLPPGDLLTILMDLCHASSGRPIPPSDRLYLLRACYQQRPQVAVDFCSKWLEVHPAVSQHSLINSDHPIDKANQLLENLFLLELSRITGVLDDQPSLLERQLSLAHSFYSGLVHQLLAQKTNPPTASMISDQAVWLMQSGLSKSDQAGHSRLALGLAERGQLEEDLRLLPPHDAPLPQDANLLYPVAKISFLAGDEKRSWATASRILELIEHKSVNHPLPVRGDGFSLLNFGQLLLDLHKPAQAAQVFERAVGCCPNDAGLLKLLADSLASSHGLQKAAETLATLVSLDPGDMDYCRAYARSLEDLGLWETSLAERLKVVSSHEEQSSPSFLQDQYAYANCAIQANHPQDAIKVCDEILAQDQEDCQALIYCGQAYLLQGETERGMDILTRATQTAPDRPEAWLALAAAQKKIYTLRHVIDTLKNATQAAPASPQVHYLLGDSYLQDGQPALALPELQTAFELSPDDPSILVAYAGALKLLGHADLCHEIYAKAYHLQPEFPGLAQDYARILLDLGELEEAISPLETLIDSRSVREITPYLDYARSILTLHSQGSTAHPPMKALIALNEVLQLDPQHAEGKALTAEALTANGENELAYQAYREALDTSLKDDPHWFERLSFGFGRVASSIGRYDTAIAALQEAGQANPQNPAIFMALAQAYISANLPEDALKAARNVLSIDGENPDHLAWFAGLVTKIGFSKKAEIFNSSASLPKEITQEALASLAKAIQLAPTRTDLLVQLGNLQSSLGELDEAQATFISIASLDFATVGDLISASMYLSSVGDHPSAIACLEKGISIDQVEDGKHDTRLYASLAQEHVKNHDHASAINILDKAIEVLPGESSLISQKVEILLDLGQPHEALSVIETALQKTEAAIPNVALYFLASQINRSMGDFPSSVRYARLGATCLEKDGSNSLASLPIQHRTHLAEIARALLQPDLAYQILQAEPARSRPELSIEPAYLDFLFLHTELALDTGERLRPEIQDVKLEVSHPSFPRLMAINARLLNLAGNYHQAEQVFQLAYNKYVTPEQSDNPAGWMAPHVSYLTSISLLEAALELGLWDQARSFAQQQVDAAPTEPLSFINMARLQVLKAEFSHLCELLEVSRHKPAPELEPEQAYLVCHQVLDQATSLLQSCQAEFNFDQYEAVDDQILRWQARTDILFQQAPQPDFDPLELLSNQPTPADTAATINYLQQSHPGEAASEGLTRIIKLARACPRSPGVMLQVALALQDTSPLDALKSLQSVLEHNPGSQNPGIAFCNILAANLGLAVNEYVIARDAVEQALSFWPDEPAWHGLAAHVYQQLNDAGNAASHLQQAASLAPDNVIYHMKLGRVLYENAHDNTGMLAQALTSFENVLALEANNISALIHLAGAHHQLKNHGQAEEFARKALILAPDRADLYLLLSQISIEKNDFQGAYEFASKAIQTNPTDIQSTVMLARSLSAMGRQAEALAKLNSVIPLVQEARSLHLERVDIIRQVNGPQIALNELKSLTTTYPGDFGILAALAKSYYEAGKLENTVAVAQQALDVCPQKASPSEQADLHLLIGQALRQSGQLDQSIQHLTDAIQLAPNRLEPYLELGLARKERREYQQALQIFEHATLIAPADPRAVFQAGLALKESKDYQSSETMLRRAVSLAPNDLVIRRQLAAVVALNLIHNPRSARINA